MCFISRTSLPVFRLLMLCRAIPSQFPLSLYRPFHYLIMHNSIPAFHPCLSNRFIISHLPLPAKPCLLSLHWQIRCEFHHRFFSSLHQEIDKKYPNRVILDVGLYDVDLETHWKLVRESLDDGGAHYEVIFQLIIFRPLVEEICIGTIAESNEDGIRIRLGDFFHDIFLPGTYEKR